MAKREKGLFIEGLEKFRYARKLTRKEAAAAKGGRACLFNPVPASDEGYLNGDIPGVSVGGPCEFCPPNQPCTL